MNDSNWKKLVDAGEFISISRYCIDAHADRAVNAVCRRYSKAISGATLSATAFDSINSSADPDSVKVWSSEEKYAQRERVRDVTVMDIYDIKMKRRELIHITLAVPDIRL
jgi:hypothetical protein